MGNKRANTLFIGTIVAAISIVLAVGAIIPAMQNDTSTVSTGLNPLGHVSLIVYDPDGNVVAYRQGDNFVTSTIINAVGNNLFDAVATGFDAAGFKFLALCNGTSGGLGPTLQTDAGCTEEAATLRVNGDDGTFALESEMTAAGSNYKRVLSNTFTILLADDNETFDELAIFDTLTSSAGNMLAVATFASFVAQTGGAVLGTYTVTISG